LCGDLLLLLLLLLLLVPHYKGRASPAQTPCTPPGFKQQQQQQQEQLIHPFNPLTQPNPTGKMSAIQEETDGPAPVLRVLFALFPKFNTLDVAGPLEVLNWARHNPSDACELLNQLRTTSFVSSAS
jgi:hypothetical protein